MLITIIIIVAGILLAEIARGIGYTLYILVNLIFSWLGWFQAVLSTGVIIPE